MTRIEKPWGYELIWAQHESYVGKILHINPGQQLSLQYHKVKDETILIQKGHLFLEIKHPCENPSNVILYENMTYHIPPYTTHRMSAPADSSVKIIEVSTSELDDVVRIQDDYNRLTNKED